MIAHRKGFVDSFGTQLRKTNVLPCVHVGVWVWGSCRLGTYPSVIIHLGSSSKQTQASKHQGSSHASLHPTCSPHANTLALALALAGNLPFSPWALPAGALPAFSRNNAHANALARLLEQGAYGQEIFGIPPRPQSEMSDGRVHTLNFGAYILFQVFIFSLYVCSLYQPMYICI